MVATGRKIKLALITTTIRIPRVLAEYRKIDKEAMFFVAGDRRTPHREVKKFILGLGNAVYYSDTDQEKLGYHCSELIGWNCIMRRNIALLEALKYGADIIITIDDDNFPLDENYFNEFIRILTRPFSGFEACSADGWFNVGEYMVPRIYHRGFPYEMRNKKHNYTLGRVQGVKIGVAAGLWLQDPDINAIDRIVFKPQIEQVAEVIREGICVGADTFVPVGTQNTAYLSGLAPLFMVWAGVGRYDDIWASYFAQTIMRTLGYCIHYGLPFVRQERNEHNLWQNLKDELLGMEYTTQLCADLLKAEVGNGAVLDRLERTYTHLKNKDYLPKIVYELGKAWCRDLKEVIR